MEALLVFKDITIKSFRGKYKALFYSTLSKLANNLEINKSHIIVDHKVFKLYQNKLEGILSNNDILVIKSNEKNKSLERMALYVDFLLRNGIRRSDNLLAIGGGIIQDITCFLSSTLLRGIEWNFVPTTLLAQADSCIGSKSSINCNGIKNVLGTFAPPKKIYICPVFLSTLKKVEIQSGIGEMLKVHAIAGTKEFQKIKANYNQLFTNKEIMLEKIYRSLQIKKKYIEIDEFDKGPRNIFNYGHSFGHAIERASNYNIPHGIAVSIGCDLANYTAMNLNISNKNIYASMHETLKSNYKNFSKTKIDTELFYDALGKDKKNINNQTFSLVMPNHDGKIFINNYKNNKKIQSIINKFLTELKIQK